MSKKVYYLLIALLEVLTAASLCVGIWTFNANRRMSTIRDLEIAEDGEGESQFIFRIDGMLPGDSQSYTVNLSASSNEVYRVSMEFSEKGDVSLARYITVAVLIDGQTVHTAPLSEYFSDKALEINVDFSQNTERVMEIAYILPVETDDGAQGAVAKFDAVMRVERA